MSQRQRRWRSKFAVALRGLAITVRDQSSFRVHLPVAGVVVLLAAVLKLDAWRWGAILLAITMVISMELMNTSIERLVKTIHPEKDPGIGDALDTAASAVLIAAVGAAAIAGVVFLGPLLSAFGMTP